MALVTITGNAWDHNQQPIDPLLRPELWFRPLNADTINGLMTHREVKATLTLQSGAFSAQLEQDAVYIPEVRWLADPDQWDEAVANRSSLYSEWPAFTAWVSGPIDEQPPQGQYTVGLIWTSLDPPPKGFIGYWLKTDDTVTSDDTDPTIGDFGRVY